MSETKKVVNEKIDAIAQSLTTKFKSKVITQAKELTRKFISTGNPLVDWVFGKGLPVGRVVEIFGEEGVGKSTLAYHILAECYRKGGIPILFDTEESFSSERGLVFGLEKVIIEVPETVEQAFEMLLATMEKMNEDDFGVVVWDSLAATPPASRLEGRQEIGAKARAVSDYLQILLKKLEATNLSLIVLNQVRSIIDMHKFGLPLVEAPSARALKHEAVIRAQIKRQQVIKVEEMAIGINIEIMTHKNKIVSPYRMVKLCLLFETGISIPHSVIENALHLGLIKQTGGWLEFEGVKFRRTELSKLTKEQFDLLLNKVLNALQERYERVFSKFAL
jgi:recombination protein RecA